jgi:hypothetical protein
MSSRITSGRCCFPVGDVRPGRDEEEDQARLVLDGQFADFDHPLAAVRDCGGAHPPAIGTAGRAGRCIPHVSRIAGPKVTIRYN